MRRATRDRLLLPILLPIGIIAAIVLLMVLFSRILLNTSADAATVVALVVSVTILVAAGVIASRGRGRGAGGLGSLLGVVAGVAMLAGGIALAVAKPAEEGGEAAEALHAEITAPPGATADGFDERVLELPADEPIELTFHNEDPGVPHNVAIAEGDNPGSPLLFEPDGTITGTATAAYSIDPLSEGSYHFFCEVHPTTMKGDVKVAPGAAGEAGGGEGAGGGVVAIAAQDLQFDKQELDFQADTPSTLEFDNGDAGIPHNVAIYEDDTLAENLFTFDPFPGPAQQSFDVPGLPQGEFYFHCDVHPTMNGTVVVSEGGEPPGGGGTAAGGEGEGGGGTEAAPPPEEPLATSGGAAAASIAAENLQFSASTLSLEGGAETTLSFDNRDAGVPHNVSIYAADPASEPGAEQLFTFEPFPGPEERDFTIPGLEPGTYVFVCDVHPTMKGDVRVA